MSYICMTKHPRGVEKRDGYMDEREELKQELQEELKWVKYRQKMLDLIDEKLLEMKLIAERAKEGNLSPNEIEVLKNRLKSLEEQVRALDSESRKMEDRKIIE